MSAAVPGKLHRYRSTRVRLSCNDVSRRSRPPSARCRCRNERLTGVGACGRACPERGLLCAVAAIPRAGPAGDQVLSVDEPVSTPVEARMSPTARPVPLRPLAPPSAMRPPAPAALAISFRPGVVRACLFSPAFRALPDRPLRYGDPAPRLPVRTRACSASSPERFPRPPMRARLLNTSSQSRTRGP